MSKYYIECPLNKHHTLLVERLQKHLQKCMKSEPLIGVVTCPFNNQHIIDASNILEHCNICPNIEDGRNRTNVDKDRNTETAKKQQESKIQTNTVKMEDPFVTCPFDTNHRIMISRLQGHLLKCIRNHSQTEFTICPFNDQHVIEASKIMDHCSICPNIKDVLTQANISKRTIDSSESTSACYSVTKEVNNNMTALSRNTKTDRNQVLGVEYQERQTMMINPSVICPLDNNHIIEMSRFWNHFQKCKKKYSMIANASYPLNNERINTSSQTLLNNSFINMNDLSFQENIYENRDDLLLRSISSLLNITGHSASTFEENSTNCSKNIEIIKPSKVEKKSSSRPTSTKLETSEIEASTITPPVQTVEIPETDKNSSGSVSEMPRSKSRKTTSDTHNHSKDSASHFCDQLKSLVKEDVGYYDFFQKLRICQSKEIAILKESHNLRKKRQELKKEKKELIERFKSIVFLTTVDSDDDSK